MGYLAHGDGGLDAGGDGVEAGGEAEEVEGFGALADGVLGVDFGDVGVGLLDGFFELVLFGRFVFAGFGGLAVQLFCCELGWGGGLAGGVFLSRSWTGDAGIPLD